MISGGGAGRGDDGSECGGYDGRDIDTPDDEM